MSTVERKLLIAFNPNLVDKNVGGDARLYREGFENLQATPIQFAEGVSLGWAYCAQLSGPRQTENFKACNIASIDIDRGMTVGEALAHPLVAGNALLLFTTASHTPEAHRFRIVFLLPSVITRGKEIRRVVRGLTRSLGGDPSATDPTRISFGNRSAEFHWINKELSPELMTELAIDAAIPERHDVIGSKITSRRSVISIGGDQVLQLADKRTKSLQDIPVRTPVHCPVHGDSRASAFVVESQMKIRGVHCCVCNKTYWPTNASLDHYNFGDFLETSREVHASDRYFPDLAAPEGWDELQEIKPQASRIHIVNGFVTPEILQPGITFVMSPKGTGKTFHLNRHAQRASKALLVGHRRSLIRGSCTRLELTCYLDRPNNWEDGEDAENTGISRDRYGICLDSLEQIPPDYDYELLILDECEQVLTHLVSNTIASRGSAHRIYLLLSELVRRAKYVILLDADLSFITYETFARMGTLLTPNQQVWRGNRWSLPRRRGQKTLHVWINDVESPGQKDIEIFDSKNHLRADLVLAIEAGKRCFVASNNKRFVADLAAALSERFRDTRRVIQITSDTTTREDVRDFIDNAKERAAIYDVMLCSPSLGTGVDITFPENAQLIDCVYGFFEHGITTHFDIDQQLHRVRHPGAMKVWISPSTFRFETHVDVVRSDLLRAGMHRDLLIGYETDGRPQFDEHDPLINLAARVVSRRRASMNDLRGNFIRHKQAQGCIITVVAKNDELSIDGYAIEQRGRHLSEESIIASLMGATALSRLDYERINKSIEFGALVSEADRWAVERTRLELFYRQAATPELIQRDDRGRHRQRVSTFQALLDGSPEMIPLDPEEMIDGKLRFVTTRERDVPNVLLRVLHLTPVWRTNELGAVSDQGDMLSERIAGSFDSERVFDARDLTTFARFLLANKGAVENVLGLYVRSDIPKKPTQQLGQILKLTGLTLSRAGSVKLDGKKIYQYQLGTTELQQMNEIVRRRSELKAWTFMTQTYGTRLENPRKSYDDLTIEEEEIADAIDFLQGQRGDNREEE